MGARFSRNGREVVRLGGGAAGLRALSFCLTAALSAACASGESSNDRIWAEAHVSLEAAERAFASRSLERGMRDAFLTFLAADGVIFQPGPIRGRPFWEQQPEVDGTLWWTPRVVEVARSDDLGYTTGPYRFSAGERIGHGWYSSVWRRGPDSAWHVAVDLGTRNAAPAPPDTVDPGATHVPWDGVAAATMGAERDSALADLVAVDGAFNAGLASGPGAAYRTHGSARLRVHRDGRPPMTHPDTIAAWGQTLAPGAEVERAGVGIARAGDLGYTYGTVRRPDSAHGWLRVWRREAGSGWRLVLEVASPILSGA